MVTKGEGGRRMDKKRNNGNYDLIYKNIWIIIYNYLHII